MKKDLLKEAIADAKAVKETALANAKIALEEAFTPRLHSMLSAKLAEEMSDEDEMQEGDEENYEDFTPTFENEDEGGDSVESDESTDTYSDDDDMSGDGDMSDDVDVPKENDDDLDLDEIIKELEMEGGDEHESHEMDEYSDDDNMNEAEDEMSDDEDIDINEIIRSLREEDDETEETHDEPADDESEKELAEAYNVIQFLRGKINEVNLLNAKLLYSNKLFRNFTLNENQKMKVIENFDRAHSLREVKLVYSTLAEGFKMPATKKVVKESFASKPSASTKPAKTQVLSEGADLAARFKKLAGLK